MRNILRCPFSVQRFAPFSRFLADAPYTALRRYGRAVYRDLVQSSGPLTVPLSALSCLAMRPLPCLALRPLLCPAVRPLLCPAVRPLSCLEVHLKRLGGMFCLYSSGSGSFCPTECRERLWKVFYFYLKGQPPLN
jgi:hypothetical protein